ncbi:MAG: YwaF family protein [Lachnospiraceae bacterium]|nr:YwaF family protein [Lachnospiraceae bacterium]
MADIETAIKYFWMEKSFLPYPLGYPLFSPYHLLTIFLLILSAVLVYRAFRNWDKDRQLLFLRAIVVFLPFLEAFKIGLLVSQGVLNATYLPLYMCSMGIYVFPFIVFSTNPKITDYAATVSLLVFTPGAIAALIFPDWITFYHPLSFMSIYSYLWHIIVIAFPVYAHSIGLCTVKKYSIIYILPFFAVLSPLIITADHMFGCNFWFLEQPSINGPFAAIYDFLGYPLYVLFIIFTFLVFVFITQSVFIILQNRGKRDA